MKKHTRWVAAALACTMLLAAPAPEASAARINSIRSKRQQSEQNLSDTQEKINDLQESQSAVESELDSMDAELVELMSSISSLEQDLVDTQKKIEKTEAEYEQAKAEEEKQYEDMKARIKYLYESGDAGYLAVFLKAESFTDMLNKVEYAQTLYDTDRDLLNEYQVTKKKVEDSYASLQEEQSNLEEAKAQCADQKESLQAAIDEKSAQSAEFASEIAVAQMEAQQYEAEIASAKNEEEKLKAYERQRQAIAKAIAKSSGTSNSTGSSGSGSSTDGSGVTVSNGVEKPSDAGLGQQIVDYAVQFVGNPYVYGGEDIYNGIDCSAFTQQVFAHFGIGLPRTSLEQRNSGFEVPYSEARAGDLICYSGHVAIYMGGGRIVHASNSQPYPVGGIKISPDATYRQIITVRRCY